MQSFVYHLSGRNSARICDDTTREQLSVDFVHRFCTIFNFLLDINSLVDQVQS